MLNLKPLLVSRKEIHLDIDAISAKSWSINRGDVKRVVLQKEGGVKNKQSWDLEL